MESQLILAHVIVIVLSIPLALGLVRRNRFYGFRLSKTLVNDEIWARANKLAGRVMTSTSVIGMGVVFLAQQGVLPIVDDMLTLASLAPMMIGVGYLVIWVNRQP